jgi:hypothetical protein
VIDLVAPLTTLVGEAWASGQLATFEEHLYTESLTVVMRSAIFAMPQANRHPVSAPRILLTTLPQERHGLGLLMAEAMCVAEGAHCISLGVQTPLAGHRRGGARPARRHHRAVVLGGHEPAPGARRPGRAACAARPRRRTVGRRQQRRAETPAAAYVRVFELADGGAIAAWRGRHAGSVRRLSARRPGLGGARRRSGRIRTLRAGQHPNHISMFSFFKKNLSLPKRLRRRSSPPLPRLPPPRPPSPSCCRSKNRPRKHRGWRA